MWQPGDSKGLCGPVEVEPDKVEALQGQKQDLQSPGRLGTRYKTQKESSRNRKRRGTRSNEENILGMGLGCKAPGVKYELPLVTRSEGHYLRVFPGGADPAGGLAPQAAKFLGNSPVPPDA